MNIKILSPVFILLSVVYLLSLSAAPYTGQFLVKVAPIVVLIAIAASQLEGKPRSLIVAALIASGIGDIFLALTIENGFIFGLGAFLIAQMIYSFTFIRHRTSEPVSTFRKTLAGLITIYAISMAVYILPDTGEMLIPVTIYLAVISIMGLSAIVGGLHPIAVLGALSFVASDSALALGMFKTPLPYSSFVVMITYYLAQFAIVKGMILHCQASNVTTAEKACHNAG